MAYKTLILMGLYGILSIVFTSN